MEATCWQDDIWEEREIIEIGAVKISNGEIIDRFDIFVKPVKNPKLSEYCLELTHIRQCDVDTAISQKDAVEQFYLWATNNFKENPIYLSWGTFDKIKLAETINTYRINRRFFKQTKNHYNMKKIYASMLHLPKQISMTAALEREKIQLSGMQHRAINDVENLHKIFKIRKNKILKNLKM